MSTAKITFAVCMSIDTEFYGRPHSSADRKKEKPRKIDLKVNEAPPKKRSWRDIIFQTLFPGLFLVLVYYHFFVFYPETPVFYSKLLEKCIAG